MDYICIGSSGFAQVGQADYCEKARIEMKVLKDHAFRQLPVPEELRHLATYRVKSFPHDFGTYHELVIIYDDRALDELSESNPALLDKFWEWANEAESLDLESLEVLAEISEAWYLHNWETKMKPLKTK